MKSLIFTVAACLLMGGLSEMAVAGGGNGGGSKNARGTIRVVNDSDFIVAVIVDNEDPPLDEDEFLDAGGRFLEPGQSVRFRVAVGDHSVSAALIDDLGDILDADIVDVEVERNRTDTVTVTNDEDFIEIETDD